METQAGIVAGIGVVVSQFLGILALAILYWRARRALSRSNDRLSSITAKYADLTEQNKAAISEKLAIEERFKPVIDIEVERDRIKKDIVELNSKFEELRSHYGEKKAIYDKLLQEVAIFDERLSFGELGVYEPHFDFTDSEDFKSAINQVHELQKKVVSEKSAVICTANWLVDGSTAKGETMVNRGIRLTLRAFNNECDAAIANARWNNVNAMEKRILRAFEQINNMNKSMSIVISEKYKQLMLDELFLTHEYKEKLKLEREERAEIARAQREELKLQRDIERAEEDEANYQRMLNQARAEAEHAVGPKLDAYNEQVKLLSKQLSEATERLLRAQSMAEKTRSGYVYIISNVGSFGPDMVKIGVTRRLDPSDRVRELGDASVPFLFDTHAIIYSDNAPSLERALHVEFEAARVNTQNLRKEFFRASIDDVELAVKRLAPDAPFFKDVEAQEYRETLAKRKAVLLAIDAEKQRQFPDSI